MLPIKLSGAFSAILDKGLNDYHFLWFKFIVFNNYSAVLKKPHLNQKKITDMQSNTFYAIKL